MTEPLTQEWSWRTFIAGHVCFLGLFLAALSQFITSMPGVYGGLGLVIAAAAQAYNAWVARDDKVSSEGGTAPKDS